MARTGLKHTAARREVTRLRAEAEAAESANERDN